MEALPRDGRESTLAQSRGRPGNVLTQSRACLPTAPRLRAFLPAPLTPPRVPVSKAPSRVSPARERQSCLRADTGQAP